MSEREMRMGKIFCLMGKSASGKDTIYHALREHPQLSLCGVVPYTTRPIRAGETEGETYHFCTEAQMKQMQAQDRLIEQRTYDTICGPWHYFTADDGQINLRQRDYLLIGTPESLLSFRRYFGAEHVLGLYIWLDDGLRLERALLRERQQKEPKYAELCRRFLADEQDFSDERLAQAGVAARFENRDLKETVETITAFIQAMVQEV